MKNKIALLILVLAVFFNSCKKKNDEPPGLAKLKMSISDVGGSNDTAFYTYNVDGTINTIQEDGGITRFTYNGIFITRTGYNSSGHITVINTYILNTDGYADSLITVLSSGLILRTKLTYDTEGFLTQENTFIADTLYQAIFTENDAKNIVRKVYPNHLGSGITLTASYAYFLEDKNSLGNENTGMPFLGKSSENAHNSVTSTNLIGGSVTAIYTYEFDEKGRIVTQNEYSTMGSNINNKNAYTYY